MTNIDANSSAAFERLVASLQILGTAPIGSAREWSKLQDQLFLSYTLSKWVDEAASADGSGSTYSDRTQRQRAALTLIGHARHAADEAQEFQQAPESLLKAMQVFAQRTGDFLNGGDYSWLLASAEALVSERRANAVAALRKALTEALDQPTITRQSLMVVWGVANKAQVPVWAEDDWLCHRDGLTRDLTPLTAVVERIGRVMLYCTSQIANNAAGGADMAREAVGKCIQLLDRHA